MSAEFAAPEKVVFVSHKVKVNASVATVWKMFVDKIRNPQKFVPGIEKVEILKEYSPLAVERCMYHVSGQVIRETISADELTKTVLFKHNNDPKLSGIVTNTIYEENDGKDVFIEFVMSWTAKTADGQSDEEQQKALQTIRERMSPAMIIGAVTKTAQACEAAEKEATATA